MIDDAHGLAITRQAALLGLSRSSVYYRPRPVAVADLGLMRRLDELHLELPFAGSRMLRDLLRGEDLPVGRVFRFFQADKDAHATLPSERK